MKTVFLIAIIFGCAFLQHVICSEHYVSYDGYKLIRVSSVDNLDHEWLKQLLEMDGTLDVWKEDKITGADILASPKQALMISNFIARDAKLSYKVLIENVGKIIAEQSKPRPNVMMDWLEYHTPETIYEWMFNISSQYSSEVEMVSMGLSYENRDMTALRLSKDPSANRPVVFIDSTHHAREWITPATITYFINELLTNPDDNELLNSVDFYFVPLINPDGYSYSITNDRLWRKTRSEHVTNCFGVDPNRNYDFQWDSCPGCSSGECNSIVYRGPFPFSETETDALREYVSGLSSSGVNLQAYISLHSYGLYFVQPWGYTNELPDDFAEMQLISQQVAEEIFAMYGTQYTIGTSSTVIYPTDGSSQDWAYGRGYFKYSFLFELRDTGEYGFLLPPDQILPTAQETWEGVKAVARHLIDNSSK